MLEPKSLLGVSAIWETTNVFVYPTLILGITTSSDQFVMITKNKEEIIIPTLK